MKKNLLISVKLTALMIILCAVIYPLLVAAVGLAAPGSGKGKTVSVHEKIVGYENIGQNFTDDKYFNGRPSAVAYNAAGSAGSNKGPSNPEYLQILKERIDSFLVHNPGINKAQIPAELITASGSGLDPDISPASAFIQVKRIAAIRSLDKEKLNVLVNRHIFKPIFGPATINVLKLNIDLDNLK